MYPRPSPPCQAAVPAPSGSNKRAQLLKQVLCAGRGAGRPRRRRPPEASNQPTKQELCAAGFLGQLARRIICLRGPLTACCLCAAGFRGSLHPSRCLLRRRLLQRAVPTSDCYARLRSLHMQSSVCQPSGDHLRWQSSEMILRRLPPGDQRRSTMPSSAGAPSRAARALALTLTLSRTIATR